MSVNENTEAARAEDTRDLGFGSVVTQDRSLRLLNRDGSFNIVRRGLGFFTSISPYQALLAISWWRFNLLIAAAYLLINVLFAFAYLLCGRRALLMPEGTGFVHAFGNAFDFSVQTLSTIGYGHIQPAGFAANALVTVEALVGLLGFALATGLLFARFSRPSLKVRFSSSAVVAPYHDISGFMFRIANDRNHEIIDLTARVLFSRMESENGRLQRRFHELPLERRTVAFFPGSWTVVHPIDEASPLAGLTPEDLLRSDAEFLILLTGTDETFSQTVHARSSYRAEEILFGVRFVKIVKREGADRPITVDLDLLSETEAAPLPVS